MLHLARTTPSELTDYLRGQPWHQGSSDVVRIESAGEGNMNRVRRVTLANGRSLILKQSSHAVERYPDIPAPIERNDSERQFYERVATTDVVAKRMPLIVGADRANHLLALTDLGSASDCGHWYDGNHALQIHHVLPKLLSWLASLHRLPVEPPLRNLAMRELNHEHIFVLPFAPDNSLELGELKPLQQAIAGDEQLVQIVRDLGLVYLGEAVAGTPALLHGDFYPGSWLIDTDNDSIWAIDPEFTFIGPAEFDLGVCLAHLLMCGLPAAEASALLTAYKPDASFSMSLTRQFAGVEVLRRLLGVAQLPLTLAIPEQTRLADTARQLVTQPTP